MGGKVAVFLDTENLTHWIKNNGPENLLSELSSIGQIIVRRAYAKWTNQNLQGFQAELNRQGFELIHNFHPVAGKNSSDIQLTVDVMEYALKLTDVNWFVLATGDSDFSPLFRRLREMGKEVIGVGPRSPLSESVKTSCSRFIFTDIGVTDKPKETIHAQIDDAMDLLEKALNTFDGPALCSALKERMTNIDSAFDEKLLGFKSFTDFLKSSDFIVLNFDEKSCTWTAQFGKPSESQVNQRNSSNSQDESITTEDLYRRYLRKKGWRLIPREVLTKIYDSISSLEPISKSEIIDNVTSQSIEGITATDVRKAVSILWKSRLFDFSPVMGDENEGFLLKIQQKENFLREIDIAILVRLLAALEEQGESKLDLQVIESILYGKYGDSLKDIISEAMEIKDAEQSASLDAYSAGAP